MGPGVTGECVDIKEYTSHGLVEGNVFDGRGVGGEARGLVEGNVFDGVCVGGGGEGKVVMVGDTGEGGHGSEVLD